MDPTNDSASTSNSSASNPVFNSAPKPTPKPDLNGAFDQIPTSVQDAARDLASSVTRGAEPVSQPMSPSSVSASQPTLPNSNPATMYGASSTMVGSSAAAGSSTTGPLPHSTFDTESFAAPVNPIIRPTAGVNSTMNNLDFQSSKVAATEPIMMPEPAKMPDPVEEELKAPMKAAAPVPGSIGSAVSGPKEQIDSSMDSLLNNTRQTPNVSFVDPATQPENAMVGGTAKVGKKNNSRVSLIALIAVAAMVIVALVAVLIIQLMSRPSIDQSTPNDSTTLSPDNASNNSGSGTNSSNSTTVTNTLSCTRNMTVAEIANHNDAISGTISISAKFDDNNLLTMISRVDAVVYDDENAVSNEPIESETHEAAAENLNNASALTYYLPVSESGVLDLTKSGIQANYRLLDFTCEAL